MDRNVAENLECDNKSIVCGSGGMIESICITNSTSNYSPYTACLRLIAIRPPINASVLNLRWLSMEAVTALSSVFASTTCVALMTSFRLDSLSVPGGSSFCRTCRALVINRHHYCIDKIYQGKGWITRVVKEISAFAFTDLGLKTLEIIVYRENKASVRVAEKCGFEWKKTFLKGYTPRNEEPIDMELYERSYEK